MTESAYAFSCGGCDLVGILHAGADDAERGVLIVVGGPQYRVGSHRQFVNLARGLATAGIPTLRFDCRGMGDSSGEMRTFEAIDEDIKTAIDFFMRCCPDLQDVVIWGLCDAASAALFYAWRDPRVTGLVLLNPWVRTELGLAHTHLKSYYGRRLASPALWKTLLKGGIKIGPALQSMAEAVTASLRFRFVAREGGDSTSTGGRSPEGSLPNRMATSWRRFEGPVLVILSGADLTAAEFTNVAKSSRNWSGLLDLPRVSRRTLAEANHTFSKRAWRDQVTRWTLEWIKSW